MKATFRAWVLGPCTRVTRASLHMLSVVSFLHGKGESSLDGRRAISSAPFWPRLVSLGRGSAAASSSLCELSAARALRCRGARWWLGPVTVTHPLTMVGFPARLRRSGCRSCAGGGRDGVRHRWSHLEDPHTVGFGGSGCSHVVVRTSRPQPRWRVPFLMGD
jgi:hypothetical protein